MADSSHLERMGRELKCPICLSLLDSAVSLTCNHVFCNSCIHKSMRSGSNCPVCKVPYQRREIRPAAHMDNLVNIYKSMEVASGLSLFVTQNPPTIKSSDAEKLTEGNLNDENGGKGPETVKCQAEKGIKSKTPSRMKPKISGRSRRKSSFPTNKRVQVPQSPTTETPIRQAMSHCGQSKIITDITDRSSDSPSEHLPSTRNGSPLLPPFFWLREDVDKSSQQTDVDRLTGTPAKAPSFSDIKDSDDDMPSKNSPKDEMLRKCNNGYLLDSEMFEWTQRPCSPELCSTPVKMQVAVGNSGEFDGMDIEDMEAPSISVVSSKKVVTEYLDNVSTLEKNINGDCELYNNPSRSKKLHKQSSKARKKTKIMQQKKLMGQVKDAHEGSETQAGSIQSPECNHQPAADYTTKNECAGSIYTKSLKEVDDAVAPELPASSNNKRNSSEKGKSSNCNRKYERIKQSHRVGSGKQKKQKCDIAKSDTMEEEIIAQDGRHEDTVSKCNSSIINSVRKPSTICERTTRCTTHQKSKKGDSQFKYGMENKVIEGDFCQKDMVDGSQDTQLEVVAQAEAEKIEGIPKSKDLRGLQRIGKVHFQKDMPILHKHNAIPIKCAFCHSAEETEASGEMVHYSEGRPVPEDHIAGPVIHSHKNCMEWAPNVYFEDDNAVNLEEELARSRRIKCSLCGEKGAALGCYEKSCRKSFHVPCAKLLQKCRWDTDHFVILCSLHVSSKLPCELSSSQVKKEKSSLKRKFLHRQSQVAVAQCSNTNLWNRDCLRQKLVLCCSGLAYVEKETISEFAKLSGIVISTNWNSSVTHVIASIDENEACKRTIKVLMGILEGKWIVSIKWVQACMKAMRLVDESPYEINHDIHGVNDGPCRGRIRLQNKQPKLFAGFKFYFSGDFVPSYKGYLQDLVTAAGGTVLHRKPIAETDSLAASNSSVTPTVIVYNIELPDQCDLSNKVMILERRRLDAEALARSSGCRVANNSWILNSIAGHKLQDL